MPQIVGMFGPFQQNPGGTDPVTNRKPVRLVGIGGRAGKFFPVADRLLEAVPLDALPRLQTLGIPPTGQYRLTVEQRAQFRMFQGSAVVVPVAHHVQQGPERRTGVLN